MRTTCRPPGMVGSGHRAARTARIRSHIGVHAPISSIPTHPPMTRGRARETGDIAPAIGFALHCFHHGKHLAADTQRPLYSRVWLKEILGKIPAPVGNRKTPAM
ncbi:hypothetical protein BPORC_1876 [Bifidobacterium porcinum]|nr:hypothetical protein BPORC_1876 [Bifidobacterium porcinum]